MSTLVKADEDGDDLFTCAFLDSASASEAEEAVEEAAEAEALSRNAQVNSSSPSSSALTRVDKQRTT